MADQDKNDRDRRASDNYKKDLDSLFKPGQGIPDRLKALLSNLGDDDELDELEDETPPEVGALLELREALTTSFPAFVKSSSAYINAKYPLPDDEDLVVRLLDHPSGKVILPALEHLLSMHERELLNHPAAILNRLSPLERLLESPAASRLITRARQELG